MGYAKAGVEEAYAKARFARVLEKAEAGKKVKLEKVGTEIVLRVWQRKIRRRPTWSR